MSEASSSSNPTAEDLRLQITTGECGDVLDYIAEKAMVGITVDHVETAINELLGEDRSSSLGNKGEKRAFAGLSSFIPLNVSQRRKKFIPIGCQ